MAQEPRVVAEVRMGAAGKGCIESPTATLVRAMARVRSGESIRVYLDAERFPLEALRRLAEKRGLKFEHVGRESGYEVCMLTKP